MWQLPPFWRASIAVDIAAIAGAVGMPIMGADIVTGGAITNAAGVEVVAGVVVPVGGPVVTMDAVGSSCIKGYVVHSRFENLFPIPRGRAGLLGGPLSILQCWYIKARPISPFTSVL